MISAALICAMALAVAVSPADAAPSVKARIKGAALLVSGSPAADVIILRLAADDPTVLEVDVNDDHTADFRFDRTRFSWIEVSGAGGDDTIRIDESNGAFADEHLTGLDGGAGNDILVGGNGSQALFGRSGHDIIDGGPDADAIDAGAGDDLVTWKPGGFSDFVWGGLGIDTLVYRGGSADEHVVIDHAGSGLVRLTRNVGNVAMHLDGLEKIELSTLGGANTVTVNDLAGTGVVEVAVELAAGGGDGQTDTVVVNASAGDDIVTVTDVGRGVDVSRGGSATVRVVGAEALLDVLVVNGLSGDDRIEVAAGAEVLIQVVANP